MRVQSACGLAVLAVALTTLPLVMACGDDETGPDGSGLIGTWRATSIIIGGNDLVAETGVTLTLTFRSDGTFTSSVTGDIPGGDGFCEGTSCTTSGTYTYTSNTITVSDAEGTDTVNYTLSGDTLTIMAPDGTMTFERI